MLSLAVLSQKTAEAGLLDVFGKVFGGGEVSADASSTDSSKKSLQNMAILESSGSIDGKALRPDIVIEDEALVSEATPTGEVLGDYKVGSDQISIYEVREGDTLTSVAKMFDVSVNTIRWANDLPGNTVRPGQVLTILPVSGIRYTVKKGDTVASIAREYKADADEITRFNDLSLALSAGQVIIIPDAEAATVAVAKKPANTTSSAVAYFTRPVRGGTRTQGIHGHNGVDIASYSGAPILAAASGEVIIARADGAWNGGYGNYVVIRHPNGTQTLYAHLKDVSTYAGDSVKQGEQIGTMGNTGKSTGTHLHFEVRGGKNPF